jgi:hypothetical protein
MECGEEFPLADLASTCTTPGDEYLRHLKPGANMQIENG